MNDHEPERPRIVSVGRSIPNPLPEGPFDLVLADPPWRYAFSQSASRAIESHYASMSVEEIESMEVERISAEDSVLVLWATAPKLPEALQVMRAWGFSYKTGAVWDKRVMGLGYYWRVNHEHLLLGTKGTPEVPVPSERRGSVIRWERREHSEKPPIHVMLQKMFPKANRKIELFARSLRPGWQAWGNQSPKGVQRAICEVEA